MDDKVEERRAAGRQSVERLQRGDFRPKVLARGFHLTIQQYRVLNLPLTAVSDENLELALTGYLNEHENTTVHFMTPSWATDGIRQSVIVIYSYPTRTFVPETEEPQTEEETP